MKFYLFFTFVNFLLLIKYFVLKNDLDGELIFSENVASVHENIAVDPTNKDIVYFCQEANPNNITKLNDIIKRAKI